MSEAPSTPAAIDDDTPPSDAVARELKHARWSVRIVAFGLALPLAVGLLAWTALRQEPTMAVAPFPAVGVTGDADSAGVTFVGSRDAGATVAFALLRPAPFHPELVEVHAGDRLAKSLGEFSPPPHAWDVPAAAVAQSPTLQGINIELLPRRLAFTHAAERVAVADATGEHAFVWRTFAEPCPGGTGDVINWSLCPKDADADSSACVRAPHLQTGCPQAAPELVDVFAIGQTLWVVAERPIGSYRARMVAGAHALPDPA